MTIQAIKAQYLAIAMITLLVLALAIGFLGATSVSAHESPCMWGVPMYGLGDTIHEIYCVDQEEDGSEYHRLPPTPPFPEPCPAFLGQEGTCDPDPWICLTFLWPEPEPCLSDFSGQDATSIVGGFKSVSGMASESEAFD